MLYAPNEPAVRYFRDAFQRKTLVGSRRMLSQTMPDIVFSCSSPRLFSDSEITKMLNGFQHAKLFCSLCDQRRKSVGENEFLMKP